MVNGRTCVLLANGIYLFSAVPTSERLSWILSGEELSYNTWCPVRVRLPLCVFILSAAFTRFRASPSQSFLSLCLCLFLFLSYILKLKAF